jgi:hypothetical protein
MHINQMTIPASYLIIFIYEALKQPKQNVYKSSKDGQD